MPLPPLEITGESLVDEPDEVEVSVEELEEVEEPEEEAEELESAACAATPTPTAAARLATTIAPVTREARLRPMSRCM